MEPANETIESIGPSETKLYEVRRNFFGLIAVYIQIGIGFVAAVVLIIVLGPTVLKDASSNQLRVDLGALIGLLAILTWLALAIFTYIYRQSKLIITNKNLTQIIQKGLFNRQVSELSMADVEDVKATQGGMLPSIFGFGDLEIQTAGAADNFIFKLCPKPNFYGKVVLDARQQYLNHRPDRTNRY
jgi:uncharacterized membrane protein YdbT with pleckstrin-like domain